MLVFPRVASSGTTNFSVGVEDWPQQKSLVVRVEAWELKKCK